MNIFDIGDNPFHILDVSIGDTREEIANAYENALIDGQHDEQVLLQAHQALVAPKTRLQAELSWLPGVPPSRARSIVDQIKKSADISEIVKTTRELSGLAAANVFVTLCGKFQGEEALIRGLIASYDGVSKELAILAINEDRTVSGFPKVDAGLVSKTLPRITEIHGRTAVRSISSAQHPGNLMTGIVEDFLPTTGGSREFLEEVARHYDGWSAPTLRHIKDQIDERVQQLRDGSETKEPVSQIVQLLVEWDEYSQPCQLIEEAKGLDERRSKELYDELRDLCLWLANEQSQFESALKISEALLDTFPELPTVVVQTADDIGALESLIEETKSIDLFAPLIAVVAQCRADLERLDTDLIKKGFSPKSRRLAKKLYGAFADAVIAVKGTEHEGVPWMMVRGVAIELNNSESSPDGALSILDGLLKFKQGAPPDYVKQQIDDDRATLQKNAKWEELQKSSGRSDLKTGLRLANELLGLSKDDDERLAIQQVKEAFEKKIQSRRRRWLFWGATATVFGAIWLSGGFDSKKTRTNQPDMQIPSSKITAQHSSFIEEIPPIGQDLLLTKDQVRYCVYQAARIEYLRDMPINDSEIDRFNALIDHYNLRCAQFRYQQGVLQSVERELPGRIGILYSEALRISLSWKGSTIPSLNRTTSQQPGTVLLSPMSKDDTLIIQRRLAELGFYKFTIDGVWGGGTRQALMEFKASHGLEYSEDWDLETQRRLFPGSRF